MNNIFELIIFFQIVYKSQGNIYGNSSRIEKEFLEEELKRQQNEIDEEEYDNWLIKEDEFMKKQLVDECKIRIEKKRMKIIGKIFILKRKTIL